MTPFATWLQRRHADIDAEAPGALSLQQTIGRLATRLHAAQARLEQVLRLHVADEFGAWCVHDALPWPCPTFAVASGLDCTSSDPATGAVCQKPEGHVGRHGGMDRTGGWRSWM